MRWRRPCQQRGGRRRTGNEAHGPRFDEPRAPETTGTKASLLQGLARPGNKTNTVAAMARGGSSAAYTDT
jgi:hypothetical protein